MNVNDIDESGYWFGLGMGFPCHAMLADEFVIFIDCHGGTMTTTLSRPEVSFCFGYKFTPVSARSVVVDSRGQLVSRDDW